MFRSMRTMRVVVVASAVLLLGFAPRSEAAGGSFGINAGIATGDAGISTGWIVGANYTLGKKLGPISLRADVTYQDYGSDLNIFGLAANGIFSLRKIYGLAGVGWYDESPGGSPVEITLGLGLHSRGGFYFEGRWLEIEGFTTFPIVIGKTF
jgi:hypothetical protein